MKKTRNLLVLGSLIFTLGAAAGFVVLGTPVMAQVPSSVSGMIAFNRFVPATGANEIYIMNTDGSNQTRLTVNNTLDERPSWFPDNRRIAFACKDASGRSQICVLDTMGTFDDASDDVTMRIIDSSTDDFWPAVSPDGTRIAFVKQPPGGDREIYLVDLDLIEFDIDLSSNPPADPEALKNITEFPGAFDDTPTWHPGGQRIGFASQRIGGQFDIFEIDLQFNPFVASRLTIDPEADIHPAYSLDGSEIAFSRGTGLAREIYIMDAVGEGSGANVQRITNNTVVDSAPAWSPFKNNTIAFSRGAGSVEEIYEFDRDAETEEQLTFNGVSQGNPAYSYPLNAGGGSGGPGGGGGGVPGGAGGSGGPGGGGGSGPGGGGGDPP